MYQGERGLYINDPIRALVYFGRVKSVALAWILWDMLDSCPFGLFAHEVCTHPENWSDFSHWKYTTSAIVTGFIGTLPLIMAVGGSINSSEHDVFHTSVPFLLLVSTVFYMICSYCVTVLTSDYAKTSDILVSTYVGIFCEFVLGARCSDTNELSQLLQSTHLCSRPNSHSSDISRFSDSCGAIEYRAFFRSFLADNILWLPTFPRSCICAASDRVPSWSRL